MSNPKNIHIHPKVKLASSAVVAAFRGISPDAVSDLVAAHEFNWVFDFAARHRQGCSLRFWVFELEWEKKVTSSLAAVLHEILPPGRETYRQDDVQTMFSLSGLQLRSLRFDMFSQAGQGGPRSYSRKALKEFLAARWIYAGRGPIT